MHAFPADGHDADRDRVAPSERHRGVDLAQPAAAQVARHGRAGDAGHGEVEQPRMGERVGERVLERRRRAGEDAEGGVEVLGLAVAPALRGRAVHGVEPRDRVGLVARQLDEHERDPVAGPGRVLARAHVGRDHRLQRLRSVPAALREAPEPAGARGQQDVVRRDAEAPSDRADLVQAPGEADVMAARGPRPVQRRAGRRRQGHVRQRAGAAAEGSRQRRAACAARWRCAPGRAPARRRRRRGRPPRGRAAHRPTGPAPASTAGSGSLSRQPSGSASRIRLASSTTAAPSTMQ